VEWLKVKALSSNPSTTKQKRRRRKNELGKVVHTCNPSTLEAETEDVSSRQAWIT
jgi:hypothetical protein